MGGLLRWLLLASVFFWSAVAAAAVTAWHVAEVPQGRFQRLTGHCVTSPDGLHEVSVLHGEEEPGQIEVTVSMGVDTFAGLIIERDAAEGARFAWLGEAVVTWSPTGDAVALGPEAGRDAVVLVFR